MALRSAVLACLTTISVEAPQPAINGHPYSVTVELKNTGWFEIRDVTWSCDIPTVTFGDGNFRNVSVQSTPSSFTIGAARSFAHTDSRTMTNDIGLTIKSGKSLTAHCEDILLAPDSLSDFPHPQYLIVVKYKSFPWLSSRFSRNSFKGIVNPATHQLVRWVPR
jgi:hypothetical protein